MIAGGACLKGTTHHDLATRILMCLCKRCIDAREPNSLTSIAGYVVLEQPNAALVAAVSARVYTVVSDVEHPKVA